MLIFGVRNNIWDQTFVCNWVAFTIGVQGWSTYNRVQTKPEFVYQDCVKLIEHGGAHKCRCALKSLFMQNTSSITKVSPYFFNYMLWSQKLKVCSKLSELNFFPHKCLLPDVILNEGVNKLTRRKHFLRQKFLWTVWEMSVCRKNVSIIHRRSFVLLSFYGESLIISAFQVILHISVLWFHLKIFQPHKD